MVYLGYRTNKSEVVCMVIIGEDIHVIAQAVSTAIRERNAKVIQDLAKAQTEAGADYIDLNVGPMKKDTEATMQWLINKVQEATDLPLSIDTLNPVAMEAGLKACIMDTVAYANELGIPNEDIWVDPILLPISTAGEGQRFTVLNLEFIKILEDVLPGVKSTVGLSNTSNGVPEQLRPPLNRTYLVMLERSGLYSAIADPLDKEFMSLTRGKMPEIVELIYRTMDGEEIDLSSLSQKEVEYVKTARVLIGATLYSNAWLES
jgi:cobalamin-dependent methionine synthase I